MKQTAIEWFADELKQFGTHIPKLWLEKAKEMEKEQIEDAYLEGQINWEMNGKQYYNETFKSE